MSSSVTAAPGSSGAAYSAMHVEAAVGASASPDPSSSNCPTPERIRKGIGAVVIVGGITACGALLHEYGSELKNPEGKPPLSPSEHMWVMLGSCAGLLTGGTLLRKTMTGLSRLEQATRVGSRTLANIITWVGISVIQKRAQENGNGNPNADHQTDADMISVGIALGATVLSFAPEIAGSIRRRLCGTA